MFVSFRFRRIVFCKGRKQIIIKIHMNCQDVSYIDNQFNFSFFPTQEKSKTLPKFQYDDVAVQRSVYRL